MKTRILVLLTFISILTGLALNIFTRIYYGSNLLEIFSYFTIQSNFFALFFSFYLLFKKSFKSRKFFFIYLLSVIYLSITSIVYITVIDQYYKGEYPLSNFYGFLLHYLNPVLYLFVYLLSVKKYQISRSYSIYVFIYPFIYLILTFLIGSQTNYYPYPFLNPNQFSLIMIFISCIIISIVIYIIGLIIISYNNNPIFYEEVKKKVKSK